MGVNLAVPVLSARRRQFSCRGEKVLFLRRDTFGERRANCNATFIFDGNNVVRLYEILVSRNSGTIAAIVIGNIATAPSSCSKGEEAIGGARV